MQPVRRPWPRSRLASGRRGRRGKEIRGVTGDVRAEIEARLRSEGRLDPVPAPQGERRE